MTRYKGIPLGFFVIISLFTMWRCSQRITQISPSKEPFRPQYHFTPDSMWMNDPNGLVYYEGEYHLFYQYHPDSTVWGPMHWGHAVSTDMTHWEDLPIALKPDPLGLIFSGSVVVDWNHTSGLGDGISPPMVAIFTHHSMVGEKAGKTDFQNQSIAYSTDKGRTWTKYSGNPVIRNLGVKDFRDPKVIWHEESKKWVMVLAAYDKVMFFASTDLKKWRYMSDFEVKGDTRLWECPDLFPIKLKNSDITKWVLIVSMQKNGPNGGTATSYWVGDFNGSVFKNSSPKNDQRWLDYGKDNYAFVTYSDIPVSDGRRIGLGWMSNWQYAQKVPSKRWRSAMTLPRELNLVKVNKDYLIISHPVKTVDDLFTMATTIPAQKVVTKKEIYKGCTALKLTQSLSLPRKGKLFYRMSNRDGQYIDVGYDPLVTSWYIDRTHAGMTDFSPDFSGVHYGPGATGNTSADVEIYLDHSSVELFVDGGRLSMTDIFFVTKPFDRIEIFSEKEGNILEGTVKCMSK